VGELLGKAGCFLRFACQKALVRVKWFFSVGGWFRGEGYIIDVAVEPRMSNGRRKALN